MSNDITCCVCGFYTGFPNLPNGTFICKDCKNGCDSSEEIQERMMGA